MEQKTTIPSNQINIEVVSEEIRQQHNDENLNPNKDVESKVSSFFNQSWSFLKSKAKEASEKAKVAINKSKEIVHSVSNEIQKTIEDEFNSNKDKVLNSVVEDQSHLYYAPWEGFNIEESKAKEIKEQIMSISRNERHFLNGPKITEKLLLGDNVVFNFNFDEWIGTARAAIKGDKALEQLRYKLVPRKMSEYDFWRTYFYKVGIIKVSYNLDFLPRKKIIEKEQQNDPAHEKVDPNESSQVDNGSNLIIEDSDEDNSDTKNELEKDESNVFVSEYFENDTNKDWDSEFQQELYKLGISDTKINQDTEDDNLDEELRRAIEM